MQSNLKRFIFVFILSILTAFGTWSYTAYLKPKPVDQTPNPQNKFKVSTSFYPIYAFTKAITEDKIELNNITPAGAEPHDFEPSAQQITQIYSSSLFIYNGAGVDAWAEKLAQNLESKNVKTLNLSQKLVSQDLIISDGYKDPHFWLDPILAQNQTDLILDEIVKIDTVNKDFYSTNSKAFKSQLQGLDTKYKTKLNNCFQNKVVVSHDAFSYLSARYGFEIVPISGLAPESEISLQEISQITNKIKAENIKYLASEALLDPKITNTIASETGAKVLILDPIESLTDADLQSKQNYLTKMNDNLENLGIMLECK
jgi:zinc transport system substrate-binding protein